MPEEKARRVLLCGGYADGQWMSVPVFQHSISVPKLRKVEAQADDSTTIPLIDVEEYRLDQLDFFGLRLWIAVPISVYGAHRDAAVLRAILQRDVAQQLLGSR